MEMLNLTLNDIAYIIQDYPRLLKRVEELEKREVAVGKYPDLEKFSIIQVRKITLMSKNLIYNAIKTGRLKAQSYSNSSNSKKFVLGKDLNEFIENPKSIKYKLDDFKHLKKAI